MNHKTNELSSPLATIGLLQKYEKMFEDEPDGKGTIMCMLILMRRALNKIEDKECQANYYRRIHDWLLGDDQIAFDVLADGMLSLINRVIDHPEECKEALKFTCPAHGDGS